MTKTLTQIFIVLLAFVVGCKQEENHKNQLPSNWLSFKPETIPLRLRKQNFERGNLIPNPSFEEGKVYGIESKQDAFNTPGWKRSGVNVFWVNIDEPSYDTSEVSSGIHAIKIYREKSDETEDTGEGIISDFIKVIPGRYLLSLDIKLENIKSSKSRLGTKLYDAIDIRLIYYDKNKIEISPNQYSEFYQTNINTSFKWISFAHFDKIDSLGWTKVFCESAYPPFPDGYIPDDTRFVKVLLGFKGSGTMWVDNIEYKYTKDNFALKERLQPFFTQEFDAYDLLLPSPKKLTKKGEINLASDSARRKNILVVHPTDFSIDNNSEYIALVKKLSKYSITTKNSLTINDINQYNLVLSIGETNIFKKTFNDSAFNQIKKNINQGYVIKSNESLPNVVFVSSKSGQGLSYGLNTFNQLINTGKDILFNADIADWPDIENRCVHVVSGASTRDFEELNLYSRFNQITYQKAETNSSNSIWYGTSLYSPYLDDLDFKLFSTINESPSALYLSLVHEPFEIPVNSNNFLRIPDFTISGTIFEKIQCLNFEADSLSLINKIKLIAMSSYCWDYNRYNEEIELFKILAKYITNEGDRLKLISLSDKVNDIHWASYIKKEKLNLEECEMLISEFRFEDKRVDSLIRKSMQNMTKK